MIVERLAAPPMVTEIVAGAIDALLPARPRRRRPRSVAPIPLYHADARALLDGAGFSALTPVGWRTIVLDGKTASFLDVEGLDAPRFARRTTGAAVDRFIEAAALADPARDEAAAYELRIVESLCLKVAALWLAGQADRFLPYSGLSMEPLPAGEFLRQLRDRALRQRDAFERAEARIRAETAGDRSAPESRGGGRRPPLFNENQEGDEE
ncbi:MAG TPA: hypothetical protein VF605_08855 [Allosphingosinicella sp.]|jgi:hypothetical protein